MIKKIDLQYLLSYFGLIPFLLIILDKYFFFQLKEEIINNFIIYYSLLILVFIGAINWNFESKVKNYMVIYGFFPSLFSTLIIILNLYKFNSSFLIILIVIFLFIQLFSDYMLLYLNNRNKNVFYFLRFPLSVIIIFIISITIL